MGHRLMKRRDSIIELTISQSFWKDYATSVFMSNQGSIEMEGYLRLYMGAVPGQTIVLSNCVNCKEGIVILTNI